VLHARQPLLELLVLALSRSHPVDTSEHERRLVETVRGGTTRLTDPRELVGRRARRIEGLVIGCKRKGRGLPGPGVEQVYVRGHRKEPLVLVLPAEVDHRPHALRELVSGHHAAIHLHASAAVGRDAPSHHDSIGVSPALDEPPLHLEVIGSLANHPGIGALAHEQLDGGEEGRLSRARLTREHREPRGGDERGVMDERDIGYVQLVKHPIDPPCRRRRARRRRRSSVRYGRAG